jgi:transposase
MKRKKESEPKPKQKRNKYSLEQKDKARKYYLMGLNTQDISKLLDGIPPKTIEKWQFVERWTEIKHGESLKSRVFELNEVGKSYMEIAKLLDLSKSTVWRYLKQAKYQINK